VDLAVWPTHRVTVRQAPLYLLRPGTLREPRPRAVMLGGWEYPASWQVLRWARRHGIPALGFYEATPHTQRYPDGPVARVRRTFFRRLDGVLSPGCVTTQMLLQLGVPGERIVTTTNCVDNAWFASRRVRSPRPEEGQSYLYAGQLIERKNVGSLIEAFRRVARPVDRLVVAGEGPLLATLQQQVLVSGLAGQVSFPGHVPHEQLPALYGGADTFVLPSTAEVWGLVVNEALASGLHAVVSSRCGVAPEVAGMPGVQVIEPTVEALAAALERSRGSWHGPVERPEILRHGPAEFADAVCDLLSLVGGASGDPYRHADPAVRP
jgi:glycosyltransferase involved in cell wall biosynthesis